MNLGKLLAAGRSIAGGRKAVSYRVNDRVYLPKFISSKNPFAPPAEAEKPSAPAPVKPAKKGIASEAKESQKPVALSSLQPRKPRWFTRLNPISLWRRPSSGMPQKGQRPTQTELSLDRVKVVHNDLSDADVEIVPIKSRSSRGTEEPAMTVADRGDSWSRLSAKIFGVKAA